MSSLAAFCVGCSVRQTCSPQARLPSMRPASLPCNKLGCFPGALVGLSRWQGKTGEATRACELPHQTHGDSSRDGGAAWRLLTSPSDAHLPVPLDAMLPEAAIGAFAQATLPRSPGERKCRGVHAVKILSDFSGGFHSDTPRDKLLTGGACTGHKARTGTGLQGNTGPMCVHGEHTREHGIFLETRVPGSLPPGAMSVRWAGALHRKAKSPARQWALGAAARPAQRDGGQSGLQAPESVSPTIEFCIPPGDSGTEGAD